MEAGQLELHVDHIRDGRTPDDLLCEILLKSGFPLTTPVETIQLAGKTVHSVAAGMLLICLERELALELIRAMAEKKPERIVCLDEGFAGNDQLKANAVQLFKTKGVTSFKTVGRFSRWRLTSRILWDTVPCDRDPSDGFVRSMV
jgi:adenine-specific DNA-methyltransferase